MTVNLSQLRERHQKALRDAQAILDRESDLSAEDKVQIERFIVEAKSLKSQIEDQKGLHQQLADLNGGIDFVQKSDGSPRIEIARSLPGRGTKSIGQVFVEDPAFFEWHRRMAPSGQIPETAKGFTSPGVQFKGLLDGVGRKTLITGGSETSAGAMVPTDQTGIVEPLGRRPLNILNLITRRTTQSDTVDFARQTVQVTQAAPVAESNVTTYSGSTGQVEGAKPEGTIAWEKVTATVKTIAVWVPATKRSLADVAQLRAIIDQDLRDDVEEDLEDEIVGGDGTGEHLPGILHTSGVLAQAWSTDALTTIRKARTYVTVTGKARQQNLTFAVHPNDAEMLDLLKDGEDRYYFQGPMLGGVQQVWRLPVVECEALTEGEGLIGDFSKIVFWDREQTIIQVSDSHADFFVRNMVAVLAEHRGALGVRRPANFVKVALESGT
jgi:HK97 family phage major capsid protein